MSTEELVQALYDVTLETLLELDRDGLLPEMVQVGNEINPEIPRGPDNEVLPSIGFIRHDYGIADQSGTESGEN